MRAGCALSVQWHRRHPTRVRRPRGTARHRAAPFMSFVAPELDCAISRSSCAIAHAPQHHSVAHSTGHGVSYVSPDLAAAALRSRQRSERPRHGTGTMDRQHVANQLPPVFAATSPAAQHEQQHAHAKSGCAGERAEVGGGNGGGGAFATSGDTECRGGRLRQTTRVSERAFRWEYVSWVRGNSEHVHLTAGHTQRQRSATRAQQGRPPQRGAPHQTTRLCDNVPQLRRPAGHFVCFYEMTRCKAKRGVRSTSFNARIRFNQSR